MVGGTDAVVEGAGRGAAAGATAGAERGWDGEMTNAEATPPATTRAAAMTVTPVLPGTPRIGPMVPRLPVRWER